MPCFEPSIVPQCHGAVELLWFVAVVTNDWCMTLHYFQWKRSSVVQLYRVRDVGRTNSVLLSIRKVQPQVFDLGCVCHLANILCQARMKTIPLPVEDLPDLFPFTP